MWECTWDCLRFLRGFEAERGATSTFSFPQKRKTLFQNLPSVQKATILDLGEAASERRHSKRELLAVFAFFLEASRRCAQQIALGIVCLFPVGWVCAIPGCGHGLLGIWALRHGARASVFQDLNAEVSNGSNASPTQARGSPHPRSGWVACWKREEKGQVWKTSTAQVLDRATRLNILKNLNLNEAAAAPTVRWDLRRPLESAGVSSAVSFAKELFGGRVLCLATSWRDFPSIRLCSEDSPPPEERREAEDEAVFDWVLSSESLYRVEAFEDLAALLSRVLKPRGAAFFAAKR